MLLFETFFITVINKRLELLRKQKKSFSKQSTDDLSNADVFASFYQLSKKEFNASVFSSLLTSQTLQMYDGGTCTYGTLWKPRSPLNQTVSAQIVFLFILCDKNCENKCKKLHGLQFCSIFFHNQLHVPANTKRMHQGSFIATTY